MNRPIKAILFFLSRFLVDPESVQRSMDPRIADVLFILTITNSVVNPYVYGSYASEMRFVVQRRSELCLTERL